MLKSVCSTVNYLRVVHARTALKCLNGAKLESPSAFPKAKLDTFNFKFSPRSVAVEIGHRSTVEKTKRDPLPYIPIVNPRSILPVVENDWRNDGPIMVPGTSAEEKQAVRLIVIRRKKMKKHQRRKLWKRMRHRWARVRQRRKQIKEKAFQNEMIAMVKAAEEFSAEAHVDEMLRRVNHKPLPTTWRHRRLPPFIIRQLLGIDKKVNYKHTDVYRA